MAKDKKILSDIIGFHYMLFCSTLRGYARCWLDGDSDYTYYTVGNILEFCNADGRDSTMSNALANALSETSMFLWCVDERMLKRVSSQFQGSNMGELINNLRNSPSVEKPLLSDNTIGWKNDLSQDDSGNITLKF